MKKIKKTAVFLLSVLLIFIPYMSCFSVEMTPVEKLNTLGILIGPETGITDEYLSKPATRIDAAIIVLKLKGLIFDAENSEGSENFVDSDQALSEYSRKIMGYLKMNPEAGFIGYLDRFDPNSVITDQMFFKVLLTLLGYSQGSDFQWSETIVMAMLAGMKEIAGIKELTIEDLSVAIVEALDSEIKNTGMLFIEKLVIDGVISIESAREAGWDYIVIE